MENLVGIVHSTESFGASDGPGIRFIIFLKGCKMRCKYCHNPDTWGKKGGTEMTADELLQKAEKYRSYWKSDGGITVSGGEPLLQIDFLLELFKKAKARGINTCIDTAGQPFTTEKEWLDKFDELMKYTDLVMLDIKQMNNARHKEITSFSNENILQMARYLDEKGKKMWIRHVLVPTLSNFDEDLKALREFTDSLKNVERVDLLPYHTMGKFKWENLGLKYPLENVPTPTPEQILNAKRILND